MKWKMNKDNPVICFDCDDVEVREHQLYCKKKNKLIYNSKPN